MAVLVVRIASRVFAPDPNFVALVGAGSYASIPDNVFYALFSAIKQTVGEPSCELVAIKSTLRVMGKVSGAHYLVAVAWVMIGCSGGVLRVANRAVIILIALGGGGIYFSQQAVLACCSK